MGRSILFYDRTWYYSWIPSIVVSRLLWHIMPPDLPPRLRSKRNPIDWLLPWIPAGFLLTMLMCRAHTSYSATLPLRVFLALVGGGAVEGSVRWWARDHRAHHRYSA